MNSQELKKLISQGENTSTQLKLRVDSAYDIGTEMVAFSNSFGGKIIVGVNDKTGDIIGLSYDEIQTQNNLLVNSASENVKPAIVIHTDTIEVDGKNLIVATISEGMDKPYKDNKGIIWVKNGSDKRKVFSNTELRVMMQRCGTLSADTDSVEKTSYSDINEKYLKHFLYEKYTELCNEAEIIPNTLDNTELNDIVKAISPNLTIEQLLTNIQMMDKQGRLTLTGLLLLGNSIQRYEPVLTVKCISFVGNSLGGTQFRDKQRDNEVEGNLLDQYNGMLSFFRRNLKSVQVEEDFNSIARLEIPIEVFIEICINTLLHRDYYHPSPIRVFIFDNRIEIHSPGILPHAVTEETIKQGISNPRNKLLFENARFILPYTGVGSGIVRALKSYDHITFNNNLVTGEFVTTILRPESSSNNTSTTGSGVGGVNGGINEGINNTVNEGSARLNEGINLDFEGINKGIKEDLSKIYRYLQENKLAKHSDIKQTINKSDATIERYLKILKDNNVVEYVGSKKTGGYRIKK